MSSLSHSIGSFKYQTSSGWLITILKFAFDINFFDPLKELISLNNSDINDILVPDVVAASMFGIDRFPDQS